jgi:hypothetical protein
MAEALGVSVFAVRSKVERESLSIRRRPRAPMPRPPAATPPDIMPLVFSAIADARDPDLRPRALAAYLLNVELGFSLRASARALGRSEQTVRWAVPRIEDRREDPAFDAFIDRLGDQVREMAA